ncbi:RNA polymerase II associated protein 2 [Actinomortierella ambigua]|nr:RNA polymerase II associated protein 2 [Actinomortierella ambigua]
MARPTMKDDIVVNKPSPVLQQYLPSSKPATKNSSDSTINSSGDSDSTPKPKKPTRKQVLLQQNIDRRRQYESMVSEWQDKLLDPVPEQVLGEAANRLKQSHYIEIIEERNIEKLCGYPLCSRPPRDIKGKFRISLSERKVYDISPLKQFCSSKCLVASRWFESQLTEEPLYLVNRSPEQLRIVTVSIVPLDMDLEEFQRTRGRHMPAGAAEKAVPKPTDAFTIEAPDRLANVVPHRAGTAPALSKDRSGTSQQPNQNSAEQSQQQSPPKSPPMPGLSPNASAYIQSILATVPSTPSTIRIVERESSMHPSTLAASTPKGSQKSDVDQAMQDAYGTAAASSRSRHDDKKDDPSFEIVEGFRVPVSRSSVQKPSTMLLNHRKKHGASSSMEDRDGQRPQHGNTGSSEHPAGTVEDLAKGLMNIQITNPGDNR